jgi:hypothetical protein
MNSRAGDLAQMTVARRSVAGGEVALSRSNDQERTQWKSWSVECCNQHSINSALAKSQKPDETEQQPGDPQHSCRRRLRFFSSRKERNQNWSVCQGLRQSRWSAIENSRPGGLVSTKTGWGKKKYELHPLSL